MKKLFTLTEKRVLSFPPMLYLMFLFLLPAILMISMAFRVPGSYGGVEPFMIPSKHSLTLNLSLESIKFALTNEFIWQLCIRSLKYSLVTTFCCLCLGYPLALLIANSRKKHRDILLLLVIIPFWSCFLIRIYAWMIILGPNSFLSYSINYVVTFMGFEPVNILYSSFSVIVCLIYVNLPFMILPLYANLEKHDRVLLQASRDLGASRFQSFLHITLPLSMSGILAGSALVFIPSIGMFVIPELVGNNCSLMIGNLIKQQFLQTMNWPLGSVTSLLMIVVVCSVFGIAVMLSRKGKGFKNAK